MTNTTFLEVEFNNLGRDVVIQIFFFFALKHSPEKKVRDKKKIKHGKTKKVNYKKAPRFSSSSSLISSECRKQK